MKISEIKVDLTDWEREMIEEFIYDYALDSDPEIKDLLWALNDAQDARKHYARNWSGFFGLTKEQIKAHESVDDLIAKLREV